MINLRSINILTALFVSFAFIELITLASEYFTNLVVSVFSENDPDNVFVWLAVHHVFLFVLTVILMVTVFRMPLSDWGFNFHKWRTSLWIIAVFTVVFSLIEFSYMSGRTYTPDPNFPLTPSNKFYWLGFQYFLSGLGEEPLFRGLIIVLLLLALQSTRIATAYQHTIVIIVSTGFFMFAHLNVDWLSLSVSGYNFGQQTKALQLGVLFAIVFIHTRSLFAPIVLHGLANGITATIGFYIV